MQDKGICNSFKEEWENNPPYFDTKQIWILEKWLSISSKYAENSSSIEKQEYDSNIKLLSEKANELEVKWTYIKEEKDDEINQLKLQIDCLQNERTEIITQKSIFEEQSKAYEIDKQRIEIKYLDKIKEMEEEHSEEITLLKSKNNELLELIEVLKQSEGDEQIEVVVNPDGTFTKVVKSNKQSNSDLLKLNALMEQ